MIALNNPKSSALLRGRQCARKRSSCAEGVPAGLPLCATLKATKRRLPISKSSGGGGGVRKRIGDRLMEVKLSVDLCPEFRPQALSVAMGLLGGPLDELRDRKPAPIHLGTPHTIWQVAEPRRYRQLSLLVCRAPMQLPPLFAHGLTCFVVRQGLVGGAGLRNLAGGRAPLNWRGLRLRRRSSSLALAARPFLRRRGGRSRALRRHAGIWRKASSYNAEQPGRAMPANGRECTRRPLAEHKLALPMHNHIYQVPAPCLEH